METRSADAAQTRARILNAVRDQILEGGIDSISLQGVATQANLALRTLYNHFPSRSALISATLLDLAERVGSAALQHWQADPAQPRDGLRSYISGVYATYDEYAPWFDVLLGPTNDPDLQATADRLRGRGGAGATALLTAAHAAGDLGVPLDHALALVSVHTLYPVFKHLTAGLGFVADSAATLVSDLLDQALFRIPDHRSIG